MTGRVLFLGLDGASWPLLESELGAGRMPVLAELIGRGAFAHLDDRANHRTGVAWSLFQAGRTAASANRFSVVRYDPATYECSQGIPPVVPFYAGPGGPRTIAFDIPQSNLEADVDGIVVTGWGAHDPAHPRASRPAGVLRAIDEQVGPHPLAQNHYEIVWHRRDWLDRMGAALVAGPALRADAVVALMDRMPDWELCLTVFPELHSGAEAMWHGIDPSSPVAAAATAPAAGEWLRAVCRELDAAIGRLAAALDGDDHLVVTSIHGLATSTDVATLVLVPELVHRIVLGRPFLRPRPGRAGGDVPELGERQRWSDTVEADRPGGLRRRARAAVRAAMPDGALRRLRERRVPALHPRDVVAGGLFGMPVGAEATGAPEELARHREPLAWHPAHWYRVAWPSMRAFALPSFNDAEVRVNVRGREASGMVEPADYASVCEEIARELQMAIDPRTGEPAVVDVRRTRTDPFDPAGPDGDLIVSCHPSVLALEHPAAGLVGPYPTRRTGGHTDPVGFALVVGPRAAHADLGVRLPVDLAPTVLSLLGRGVSELEGDPLLG